MQYKFPAMCLAPCAVFVAFAASAAAQSYSKPSSDLLGAGATPAVRADSLDFNSDGIKDLAVAFDGAAADTIQIRPGTGGGGFGAATGSASFVLGTPTFVRCRDVNNNGMDDVIVGGTGQTVVLIITATGGIGASFVIPHAGITAEDVVARDFDQDGDDDMALLMSNNTLELYFGIGTGAFLSFNTIALALPADELSSTDINNDGDPDLIVSDGVTLRTFNGAAFLNFAAPVIQLAAGGNTSLRPTDINLDGMTDIVATFAFGGINELRLIENMPLGLFNNVQNFATNLNPIAVASRDCDEDGTEDFLVACQQTNAGNADPILNIFQRPTGTNLFITRSPFASFTLNDAVFVDANNDTKTDVIGVGETNAGSLPMLSLLVSTGLQGWPSVVTLATGGAGGSSVTTGDVDQDGATDIVLTNSGSNNLTTLLGNGDGTFLAAILSPTGAGPTDVELLDINADTRLDAVVANAAGNTFLRLVGNATGNFGFPSAVAVSANPLGIAIQDYNLDGYPDFALACAGAVTVDLILSNGGAGWFAPFAIGSIATPQSIISYDIDADGVPDLVTANDAANVIGLMRNVGAPAFMSVAIPLPGGAAPVSVAVGDYNADGVADLGAACTNVNNVVLVPGLGGGGFGVPVATAAGTGPTRLLLTDITGDGVSEIIASNTGAPSVSTQIFGSGVATFAQVPNGPTDIATADFNEDGRSDLVTSHLPGGIASVLLAGENLPFGISRFGTGTPGCTGRPVMAVNRPARIGDLDYTVTVTQVPPFALGLGLATDAQDIVGSDPFALGILFHVDLLLSTSVTPFDMFSDAQGNGFARTGVPNAPALVGQEFHLQSIWVESKAVGRDCGTGIAGLLSSSAMTVEIVN